MNTLTIFLLLAIGSFVFALLLILYQYGKSKAQSIPFWIPGKFLQGIGSLILYLRSAEVDFFTVMSANSLLLLGCAYEAFAVAIIVGKTVKQRLHIYISFAIFVICSLSIKINQEHSEALIFFLHSIFYFLPGLFLLGKTGAKSLIRVFLGVSYFILSILFFVSSVFFLGLEIEFLQRLGKIIFDILPIANFCMLLITGFSMLLIAKERSDMLLSETQNTLKKSEIQFQRVVETAIEGIIIFNKDFKITFVNENMAKVLGYTIDEILSKPYKHFLAEDQLSQYEIQKSIRKQGKDSVYERCFLRKNGQRHWFLVSAKAIIAEDGGFEGSFAMFTDIDKRKKIEKELEESNRKLDELSKKDGLTGIANRRCFDEVLFKEYSRLSRSNSKLSLVLLDIDHFKAFNDCYGHVIGDECLKAIASVIASCVNRSGDLVARYGGEEFVCILPDTGKKGAILIAEEIRQKIEKLGIPHRESSVAAYVTVSLGVATVSYAEQKSITDIIDEADKMLYKAKNSGRNQTLPAITEVETEYFEDKETF